MCLIAVCKDRRLTVNEINKAWDNNNNGAGVAWPNLDVAKFEKGFLNKQDFLDYYANAQLVLPHAVHFRLATHGGISPALTHPFIVAEDSPLLLSGGGDMLVMHNGIYHSGVTEMSALGNVIGLPISDSRIMARHIAQDKDVAISKAALTSRVATIEKDVIRMHGNGWVTENGVHFSNSSFRAARVVVTYCDGEYLGHYPRGNHSSSMYSSDLDYKELPRCICGHYVANHVNGTGKCACHGCICDACIISQKSSLGRMCECGHREGVHKNDWACLYVGCKCTRFVPDVWLADDDTKLLGSSTTTTTSSTTALDSLGLTDAVKDRLQEMCQCGHKAFWHTVPELRGHCECDSGCDCQRFTASDTTTTQQSHLHTRRWARNHKSDGERGYCICGHKDAWHRDVYILGDIAPRYSRCTSANCKCNEYQDQMDECTCGHVRNVHKVSGECTASEGMIGCKCEEKQDNYGRCNSCGHFHPRNSKCYTITPNFCPCKQFTKRQDNHDIDTKGGYEE